MRNEEKLIIKKIFGVLLVLSLTSHFSPLTSASAQSSSNNNYNLEIEDIDTVQKNPKKTATVTPPVAENSFKEPKLEVIRETAPISFSLSTTLIDFGLISPNNPTLRTTTLSLLSPNSNYSIHVFENHPLRNLNNTVIADTTCDNGACTEANPALWISNLTYGFGYRCDNLEGLDCQDSAKPDFYSQFADASKSEYPQAVMAGRADESEKKGQVTLKLNTSGTQKQASYSNNVTFIAVPNY